MLVINYGNGIEFSVNITDNPDNLTGVLSILGNGKERHIILERVVSVPEEPTAPEVEPIALTMGIVGRIVRWLRGK